VKNDWSQVQVCSASRRVILGCGAKNLEDIRLEAEYCPCGRLPGTERGRCACHNNFDGERGCVCQSASATTKSYADKSTAFLARTRLNYGRRITPSAMQRVEVFVSLHFLFRLEKDYSLHMPSRPSNNTELRHHLNHQLPTAAEHTTDRFDHVPGSLTVQLQNAEPTHVRHTLLKPG
jgi:hypothetical protein